MCFFCMIQQQIRHTQFFRKLACFFYRTVMFLIRLELIRLTEQAECLMKQPVTPFYIFVIHFIIWLITDAGKFLTALKLHGESELFRLCRSNIKECHWTSENRSAVSVFHDIKLDSLTHMLTNFLLDRHICNCLDLLCQFLMAVNAKVSFIFSLVHSLSDHTHQPDNSKHMVYMFMCNEDIVDVIHIDSCIF